jgi:hypothetical protein
MLDDNIKTNLKICGSGDLIILSHDSVNDYFYFDSDERYKRGYTKKDFIYFNPENGGKAFVRNVGNHLHDYTTLKNQKTTVDSILFF